MEQRLESVFTEAQSKVLNSSAKLSVQILAAWQLPLSQAVALTYVVRNGSESLNGTVSSGLLGQLSAELVGYFLFYPPLSIAERGCPRGSSHTCRFLSDAASRLRPDLVPCVLLSLAPHFVTGLLSISGSICSSRRPPTILL
uniref:Uncharacterized protein n=1 Tax=Paramormyrops kingsleyae TaxID=1676925 RepID=A0A3B3QS45_9TELE